MKVLVNTCNLVHGGGVQKAVQFLLGCCNWGADHVWQVVASPPVAAGLARGPGAELAVEILAPSPARPLGGRSTRRRLAELEADFGPDVVFSVSGPVYHRFRSPHLMGFAIPWLTHPSALAWTSVRPWRRRAAFRLRLAYYRWWVRRADAWLLQTETSVRGMVARLGADPRACHVVPNGCSEYYFQAREDGPDVHAALSGRDPTQARLLVFTSYKPHKNLEIVPVVAQALRRDDPATPARFVFTLDPASGPWRRLLADAARRGVADMLETVGFVPAWAGPGLYAGCRATFMPTLLETFSAVYPESMCMGLPIATSDLDFARDVCGEAAAYFDPRDPEAAAAAVRAVVADEDVRGRLITAGRARLPVFGSGEDRFRATMAILEGLARRGHA